MSLLAAFFLIAACSGQPLPAAPSPPPPPIAITVVGVAPEAGWPFYFTQVFGTGFQPGVQVAFDGERRPAGITDGVLRTSPPWREPGTTVDVTVTNPDGSSVTLARAFTYKAATLQLSKAVVARGETVVVSWSGPPDPSDFGPPDVLRLYALDDPSNMAIWSWASGVGLQFSTSLTAPLEPGRYEVRYHMASEYLLAKAGLVVR